MARLKEECGVFGIYDNKDAAALTALGLHALQHRGQEGCGIVTLNGENFYAERRLGLVGDNFTNFSQTMNPNKNHSQFATIKSTASILNSSNLFNRSDRLLFRNKKPFLPLDKISLGPLGQLLDLINVLLKAASSITNPGSSHKDDRIKQSEFNKYLYTFFL